MPRALIIGVGDGLSASLARKLRQEGYDLALAARDTGKLGALAAETGASLHAADAADPAAVAALFAAVGKLEVLVYNPSYRVRGPIAELDPEEVRRTLEVTAFGGFLAVREAARQMLPRGRGTILLTGASAGVKGFPESAPFAMGKFALRGLAQSAARELHPKGIHVAHIVIDGGIRSARRPETAEAALLDPDAIAEAYWQLIRQPRSAWSAELELRPWVEPF
ncbi:SDR family NAD(P)-dependent oxidoreductase [Siccirubricoccus sp. KC 17139]|uniref:SDR family NAD(P)-dependent oxidoreductase n=1 Tax=Siccirubricoccus soli TaxID=2899147 RepID=A0ABT1D209_9PROT|nr:SDR family NAD(P)-dependent oxidoreductase [Siccirubricoccus soli]MCO6415274.1 SDR family NAD(P)-dependent oxidoreductase [Siccirubricoccus soli]MCP2681405.1 SDR family NAD(P)-dependent oxidoreductase [Siccirubricoccus soli]